MDSPKNKKIETETLQHRLSKAVRAAEKWKKKYEIEVETNKELARRIEKWKTSCEELKFKSDQEKEMNTIVMNKLQRELKKAQEQIKLLTSQELPSRMTIPHGSQELPSRMSFPHGGVSSTDLSTSLVGLRMLSSPGNSDKDFDTRSTSSSLFSYERNRASSEQPLGRGRRSASALLQSLSSPPVFEDSPRKSEDLESPVPSVEPTLIRGASILLRPTSNAGAFAQDSAGAQASLEDLSSSVKVKSPIKRTMGSRSASMQSCSIHTEGGSTYEDEAFAVNSDFPSKPPYLHQNSFSQDSFNDFLRSDKPELDLTADHSREYAEAIMRLNSRCSSSSSSGTSVGSLCWKEKKTTHLSCAHGGKDKSSEELSEDGSRGEGKSSDEMPEAGHGGKNKSSEEKLLLNSMQRKTNDNSEGNFSDVSENEVPVYDASDRLFEHVLVVGVPENWDLGSLLQKELKAKKSKMSSIVKRMSGFMRPRMNSTENSPCPESPLSLHHSSAATPATSAMASDSEGFDQSRTPEMHEIEREKLKPKILWRFPEEAKLPSEDIADFCFPQGITINSLDLSASQSAVNSVLYGTDQTQRSNSSFVFLLTGGDSGENTTDRLYGCCVIQPRVRTFRVKEKEYHPEVTKPEGSKRRLSFSRLKKGNGTHTPQSHTPKPKSSKKKNSPTKTFQAEISICYCIVSKYPFFQLHFRVLWDIVATERIRRMQAQLRFYDGKDDEEDDSPGGWSRRKNSTRSSVQSTMNLLADISSRYYKLPVPEHGGVLRFGVHPHLPEIIYRRGQSCSLEIKEGTGGNLQDIIQSLAFQGGYEDVESVAQWTLPVLISWFPTRTLLWIIGALMCEMQVIVVGEDLGLLSACTLGLASLLKPLFWVGPLIPILPSKMFTYLEAPVPFLVGVPYLPEDYTPNEASLVVDLSSRTTNLNEQDKAQASAYILPEMDTLLRRVKPIVGVMHEDSDNKLPKKPLFNPSLQPITAAETFHSVLSEHVQKLCNKAVEFKHAESAGLRNLSKYLHQRAKSEQIFMGQTGETEEELKLEFKSPWLRAQEDTNAFLTNLTSTQLFSTFQQLQICETPLQNQRSSIECFPSPERNFPFGISGSFLRCGGPTKYLSDDEAVESDEDEDEGTDDDESEYSDEEDDEISS